VPTDAIPTPVLYLDIDGTVRQGKDDELGRFVNGPEDVRVFPEAIARMRAWKAGGGRIIGVSNQGGIALGLVEASAVIAAMNETQRQTGRLFDSIAMCQHHPDAEDPMFARCWCRKPKPGLAIDAAIALAVRHRDYRRRGEMYPPHMALVVGDRPEDEAMARLLDVDFEWAADWRAGVT